MSAPSFNLEAKRTVHDLATGDQVDLVLLVQESEKLERKGGGEPFLALTLADRTGHVDAKVWEGVADVEPHCAQGSVVHVSGTFNLHKKYGREVKVKAIRPAGIEEIDWDLLLDGPEAPVAKIEDDFRKLWGAVSIASPDLARLLDAMFDRVTWEKFRVAPGAVGNHHNYRHGLLEHTVEVARLVTRACDEVPRADKAMAVTGALVHDVGKLDTYTLDPLARDYTDDANLTGEIPLSYYRVRRAVEGMNPALPEALAKAVLHIVVSHHGTVAWGAAAVPATREAILVHQADMISSRLGVVARLEKETAAGEHWSAYNRTLGGRLFIGGAAS